MTIHSLSPAFIRIMYHSAYAPHIMTLPTAPWIEPTTGHAQGSYTAYDSTSVDADTMVGDLVALLKTLFPTTTLFDGYEIFTQASPTDPILPRAANGLTAAGTITTPGFTEAVQTTFTFFDTAFFTSKLVLLDSDSTNDFRPKLFGALSSDELAIVNEWTNVSKAWASRAGNRPATFRKLTQTLNEKLRRSYHQN